MDNTQIGMLNTILHYVGDQLTLAQLVAEWPRHADATNAQYQDAVWRMSAIEHAFRFVKTPVESAFKRWDRAVLEPIGERAYRTPCQGCFIFKCGPYTNKCFGCDPTQADYPY